MDEQDLWLVGLVKLRIFHRNSIRKQIGVTCKAKTSLGQSQKTSKLQLGGGLVVLKNGAILDG
jgi:hypothetical protein